MVKKAETFFAIKKSFQVLIILIFLLGLVPSGMPVQAEQISGLPAAQDPRMKKVYIPFVKNGSKSDLPLMAGVMAGWPGQTSIDQVMKPMDKWLTDVSGGRSTSIFATFMVLNLNSRSVKANVEDPLTLVWEAGYTPFINLPPANNDDTAYEVATSSEYETLITNWAMSFKKYANGGKRLAYIAPLQEMNGGWVKYGGDPTNFIRAYKRFHNIFTRVGVPANSVKWVFAPNGWTDSRMPMFEEYYPGDTFVDVVAISAYNSGYCGGGVWQEPETVFNNPNSTNGHYLDRLRTLAPSKPIFIAQTASSSYKTPRVQNAAEKERWLRDAYEYLSTQQSVRAVIYFNEDKECDWAIFNGRIQSSGYKTGINSNSNGFRYISPAELLATDHAVK